MQFEVKNRRAESVQFIADIEADEYTPLSVSLRLAVEWAINNNVDLSRADLYGANLSGTDLSRAKISRVDLSGADLSRAKLSGADLSGSDLPRVDLSGADLSGADLRYADLSGSDLSYAKLFKADLSGSNISFANLTGADLASADLEEIKSDFFKRLLLAKSEVAGLYDHLMRGRIDGSSYEGDCACFCGTVAKIRHEPYKAMSNGLGPDEYSLTERWFRANQRGDTPDNNQVSAITAEWLREFMVANGIAFPRYRLVSSNEFPDVFKV